MKELNAVSISHTDLSTIDWKWSVFPSKKKRGGYAVLALKILSWSFIPQLGALSVWQEICPLQDGFPGFCPGVGQWETLAGDWSAGGRNTSVSQYF